MNAPIAAPQTASRLRITEIFFSIQGETRSMGWPTVFVRLTGCPLRCGYCDTSYAFSGGQWWDLDQIMAEVARFATPYITVTGGEPLAQKPCLLLLRQLCEAGLKVSLETSGAIDISAVDTRVSRVVDLKTPGSGEVERNLYTNLALLTPHDQVKCVICDRHDYDWAKARLVEYKLTECCEVLFSPSHDQLTPQCLAEWILADKLAVRLQLQLHKYIWGDVPGH
ncbi:MAG: 7-carboxy-7-deazaguanine synthase QueE [Gammaproteobacteria bacterium]|nr:7-carboxy-7-deazaguanine synthase QueE [Gammaproteobacteria bacterium]